MIGVELLSKLMDNLSEHGFIPYSIDRKSHRITHLYYADDKIIFSWGDSHSLKLMMSKLEAYEDVSGQMVISRSLAFMFLPGSLMMKSMSSRTSLASYTVSFQCSI